MKQFLKALEASPQVKKVIDLANGQIQVVFTDGTFLILIVSAVIESSGLFLGGEQAKPVDDEDDEDEDEEDEDEDEEDEDEEDEDEDEDDEDEDDEDEDDEDEDEDEDDEDEDDEDEDDEDEDDEDEEDEDEDEDDLEDLDIEELEEILDDEDIKIPKKTKKLKGTKYKAALIELIKKELK